MIQFSLMFVPNGQIAEKPALALDNDFVPNRHQSITSTNVYQNTWCFSL